MAPRSTAWRVVAFSIVFLPPVWAQTQVTFYSAFEDGLDAERQGHWKAALAAFQRAAELHPAPSAAVFTYGNNRLLNYYPHAHMARCALELGDRSAATLHLKQSEARGEPASMREPLARRLQEAEPKTLSPPAAPEKSKPPVEAPVEIKLPGPVLSEPAPSLEQPKFLVPEPPKSKVIEAPANPAPSPVTASKPAPPGPSQEPTGTTKLAAPKPLPSWVWGILPLLLVGVAGGLSPCPLQSEAGHRLGPQKS